MRRCSPILLCCALAACYSNSLLQEPDPLPAGKWRGGIGVQGFPTRGGPAPELALRVGLSDHVEARVKATVLGADVGINAELYEAPHFRIVVMPMGKFYADVAEDSDSILDEYAPPARDILAASLPVIGSASVGPADFFAGPDVHAGRRGEDGFVALGAHAGIAFAAGARAHIVPECSLLWGAAGTSARPKPVDDYQDAEHYRFLSRGNLSGQCGLGITFGAPHQPAER